MRRAKELRREGLGVERRRSKVAVRNQATVRVGGRREWEGVSHSAASRNSGSPMTGQAAQKHEAEEKENLQPVDYRRKTSWFSSPGPSWTTNSGTMKWQDTTWERNPREKFGYSCAPYNGVRCGSGGESCQAPQGSPKSPSSGWSASRFFSHEVLNAKEQQRAQRQRCQQLWAACSPAAPYTLSLPPAWMFSTVKAGCSQLQRHCGASSYARTRFMPVEQNLSFRRRIERTGNGGMPADLKAQR
ncbi:hypothetical protein IWX50DRAFT_614948 [Phyllosticta citricarpa]|uniref:Uncharacterized protein n=1 Tax=Phyllosticta citricarpa TaxID=55181 RepID=A0ABR1L9J9_9PEZI